MMRYLVENGQLLIIDESGLISWKGSPLGKDVTQILVLEREQKLLVLLDYRQWEHEAGFNLICVDQSGSIIWNAWDKDGHIGNEPIVGVRSTEGSVYANTWDGQKLELDVETGALTYVTFVK